jgi:hypothetical protein
MITLAAIIENVTHGSRRTVEFSLPMGINEPTSERKIIAMIRKIRESIPGPHEGWLFLTLNGRGIPLKEYVLDSL